MEIQYSQLKINHLNNTPSTKAAGGRIYSGVLLKDVKVPVKVRRTLSSVGTSSSNSHSLSTMRTSSTLKLQMDHWQRNANARSSNASDATCVMSFARGTMRRSAM